MRTSIQRWGNSLALRIPKSLAADARLRQGSEVDLTIADGKLVLTPIDSPAFSLEQLLERVTAENLHGEADFGPAVGAEAW